MENKTLFLVAAGLSTRFNGFPKHLAMVKDVSILSRSLTFAEKWYSKIYVVVNCNASKKSYDCTKAIVDCMPKCELVQIQSGKGDADAVYRALEKTHILDSNASICWGDAWFKNKSIFEAASKDLELDLSNNVFEAFCAIEDHPYGWFELETGTSTIKKAVFANDRSIESTKVGTIHDQCFFNINVKNFKRLFEAYEKSILEKKAMLENGLLSDFSQCFKFKLNYEVSWFKMINWCFAGYTLDKDIIAKTSFVHLLNGPCAMAFNSEEELMEIEKNA